MPRELTPLEQVERSLHKKYRDTLWAPFIASLKEYDLLQPGDRVAVCISGGKDSMLLAKLFQLLHRRSDFPFEVRYLVMDPGYNPENRAKIEENARLLDLPVTLFETDIFQVTGGLEKNPCYLCARMRRGHLYKQAQSLGCNKIALGHHFNDVIETTVMAMFYGGQLQGMLPKLHSRNYPGMELIRPLYRVHEEDIISWARYNHLEFIRCACRFTENADRDRDSKRQEVKLLLRSLKQDNPNVEMSIFNALHHLHRDTFPGWKDASGDHSFLEGY